MKTPTTDDQQRLHLPTQGRYPDSGLPEDFVGQLQPGNSAQLRRYFGASHASHELRSILNIWNSEVQVKHERQLQFYKNEYEAIFTFLVNASNASLACMWKYVVWWRAFVYRSSIVLHSFYYCRKLAMYDALHMILLCKVSKGFGQKWNCQSQSRHPKASTSLTPGRWLDQNSPWPRRECPTFWRVPLVLCSRLEAAKRWFSTFAGVGCDFPKDLNIHLPRTRLKAAARLPLTLK